MRNVERVMTYKVEWKIQEVPRGWLTNSKICLEIYFFVSQLYK